MPTGQLYRQSPEDVPGSDAELRVDVDEAEAAKLGALGTGMPVVLRGVVAAAPPGGVVMASYPAFGLSGVLYGLTAITSPPPERDTTVVRVDVGQQIALRVTSDKPAAPLTPVT